VEAKFSLEVKPGTALSLKDPFQEILAEAAARAPTLGAQVPSPPLQTTAGDPDKKRGGKA
jgi:hypothetical protein